MYRFTLPTFIPRTVEELHAEPDEVSSLVYLEDGIAKEVRLGRFHPARGSSRPADHIPFFTHPVPTAPPLQLNSIRNFNKGVAPLGQLPQQDASESEAEEEAGDATPGDGSQGELEAVAEGEDSADGGDDDDEVMI